MTTASSNPNILLIAGHWLGAWAWDEVRAHLAADGADAVALTLPGLDPDDPDRTSRTLDEQAAAIEEAILRSRATAERPVVLVGHSGANAPVSIVLDRHPALVRRVVWVDSGPVAPGSVFAPDLPEAVEAMPLPPFDVLGQQASLEGLSAAMLERFRERAVPEPGAVLRDPVPLSDDARRRIPTTIVSCSIPSAQLQELARVGHPMFAEVDALENVELLDLPTGHWPMWSRPADLATAIRVAASRVD